MAGRQGGGSNNGGANRVPRASKPPKKHHLKSVSTNGATVQVHAAHATTGYPKPYKEGVMKKAY